MNTCSKKKKEKKHTHTQEYYFKSPHNGLEKIKYVQIDIGRVKVV